MICDICHQREAEYTVTKIVDGKKKVLHICRECAKKEGYLKDEFSFFSPFDSFFEDEFSKFFSTPEPTLVTDQFSGEAEEVILESENIAKELGEDEIKTEHLLLALLRKGDFVKNILFELDIDLKELETEVLSYMKKKNKYVEEISLSPRVKRVFELSQKEASSLGSEYIGSEHILLGLIDEKEGVAGKILTQKGITREKILSFLEKKEKVKKEKKYTKTPTLDSFSRDLTKLAKEGKLDPVIGRDKEILRTLRILSRRTKNNPVLIGEPGVGKTAIVEGIAERIVQGKVPESLKDKRVVSLDLPAIIAGTKYRGEFEDRLKKIIDEIKESEGEIIVFIDELHTVVGAGGAEGAVDASNILKPALARGELQCIGATTINEYRKYIEKDPALERRFQPVLVSEPTVDETIEILKGLRDKYEAHHRVKISDDAIREAAILSEKYITDRFLPDKAIDLIDEAASKAKFEERKEPDEIKKLEEELKKVKREKEAKIKLEDYEKAAKLKKIEEDLKKRLEEEKKKKEIEKGSPVPVITGEDVKEVLSEWTGIPTSKIASEEMKKLKEMETHLHKRIVGQEEAIKAVSEAIRRARAGLKEPNKPIGSFLFLGPTGVGKTELAKTLAEFLFGDENKVIRFDMSEYMEKHTVSRFIGAPPGYVGYEEGGQLTEAVRRRPYSVILLDEIEKAHPDIFNILLQILDDGRLTDSKGRVVDFKNTIIIMTSNLGSEILQKVDPDDKEGFEKAKNEIIELLKYKFRPEFLNRIDEIIVFHKLTKNQIKDIVNLLIERVRRTLRGQKMELEISDRAIEKIAEIGFDPIYGARPLRRTIQKEIENALAKRILDGEFKENDKILIDYEDDKFIFKKEVIK
ncbi:MAG: AAA family ATPase [Caldisericia bacterium]